MWASNRIIQNTLSDGTGCPIAFKTLQCKMAKNDCSVVLKTLDWIDQWLIKVIVINCSCHVWQHSSCLHAVYYINCLCLFIGCHHNDRPEVAITSQALWEASLRHEPTLTALRDREAGRQAAVGQGPGWIQAIGTAQPRRWQDGHSRHGNASGPGKSWQLVTK